MTQNRFQTTDPPGPDVFRWSVGCLVAAASTLGVVILVFLVSVALQPPVWLQVLLGIGLAAGGAVLAWLVASALSQSKAAKGPERPTPFQNKVSRGPER